MYVYVYVCMYECVSVSLRLSVSVCALLATGFWVPQALSHGLCSPSVPLLCRVIATQMRAAKSAIPRNGGAGVLPPSSASVASSSVDGVADVDVDPASYLFPTGEPPVAYYGDEDFAADECMLVHDVTMAEDPSADVTTMLHSLPVEVQSLFSRIRQVWVDKVRTRVLWMRWLCRCFGAWGVLDTTRCVWGAL